MSNVHVVGLGGGMYAWSELSELSELSVVIQGK